MSFAIYVEGGGDGKSLKIECRKAFSAFLEKFGLKGNMPGITACGSRENAYDSFCIAAKQGKKAILLVDSEDVVDRFHQGKPWKHLAKRKGDGWATPANTTDEQCHLMVVCMESWFLADRDALKEFFEQGFNVNALPAPGRPVESIPKEEVYAALAKSTSRCKTKAAYGKETHSFKILGRIDPAKVAAASPWAKRFIETLRTQISSSGLEKKK